jgi:2'-5' RNA ligase
VDALGPFYRELCAEGRRALRERAVHIAPFLDDLSRDKRLGLTLIVRPSPEVAENLQAVNIRLRQAAPRQFYYDPTRFHFTVVSLITASEGFRPEETPAEFYERAIREVTAAFPPFEVDFLGVCATRNSIIAKGFPAGGTLEAVREALRQRLRAAGLGQGIDERYRIRGAHVTLARFQVVEDFSALIAVLGQLHDAPFGRMRVRQAQLAVNDFYMSPDKVRIVAQIPFALGQPLITGGASPCPVSHGSASSCSSATRRTTRDGTDGWSDSNAT